MAEGSFVTVFNCMDGRTQEPVAAWMKEQFSVDFVDTITTPGPDKVLSDAGSDLANLLKDRMGISVNKHGSQVAAVIAHDDCAGNPVSKEEHLQMLKTAVETVVSWGFPVKVIGLWVSAPNWDVEQVVEG